MKNNGLRINGEEVFRILGNIFGISPSAEGYTLHYSMTGNDGDFYPWKEATAAGVPEVVVNAPRGTYYKLVGNKSVVTIQY